jgi:S1-C subfamily serine protease
MLLIKKFWALLVGALILCTVPALATDTAGSPVRIEAGSAIGSGTHLGGGNILTAAHVVEDTQTVEVITDLDVRVKAEVLWRSKERDLAILLAPGIDAKPAVLNCADLSIGDPIHTIGQPMGLPFVHTWGRVASKHLTVGAGWPWRHSFISDMTVVFGNSGGPVFDGNNELRGVVTGVITAQGSVTGFAVVVPSSAFCALLLKP